MLPRSRGMRDTAIHNMSKDTLQNSIQRTLLSLGLCAGLLEVMLGCDHK